MIRFGFADQKKWRRISTRDSSETRLTVQQGGALDRCAVNGVPGHEEQHDQFGDDECDQHVG